jgi:hypothetical protein
MYGKRSRRYPVLERAFDQRAKKRSISRGRIKHGRAGKPFFN